MYNRDRAVVMVHLDHTLRPPEREAPIGGKRVPHAVRRAVGGVPGDGAAIGKLIYKLRRIAKRGGVFRKRVSLHGKKRAGKRQSGHIGHEIDAVDGEIVDGAALLCGIEHPIRARVEQERMLPCEVDGVHVPDLPGGDQLPETRGIRQLPQGQPETDTERFLLCERLDFGKLRERGAQRLIGDDMAPGTQRVDDPAAAQIKPVAHHNGVG